MPRPPPPPHTQKGDQQLLVDTVGYSIQTCWLLQLLLKLLTVYESKVFFLWREIAGAAQNNNFCLMLLRARIVARNRNLQVIITHASHPCSQHSFGIPLRMYGMHKTHFDHAYLDLLSLVFWSCVLTICHVKLTQSTAMVQKQSLLPALCNLWLPVLLVIYCNEYYVESEMLVVSLAAVFSVVRQCSSPISSCEGG